MNGPDLPTVRSIEVVLLTLDFFQQNPPRSRRGTFLFEDNTSQP